jgi:hypothetical protein
MQTLIYKTPLVVERAPSWLAPNSPVALRLQADGTVAAFAQRPSSWLTRFGLSRPGRIGVLDEEAGDILRPIMDTGATLRVRIVEIQQAHLAVDRQPRISISVWGATSKITPPSIFSRVGPA